MQDPGREIDVTEISDDSVGTNEQLAIQQRRFQDLAASASFESLSDEFPDDKVPWLDRNHLDERGLTTQQRMWRRDGYLILPQLIPDELLDNYLALRRKHAIGRRAFANFVPYCSYDEVAAICLYRPLIDAIADLLGTILAPHFNLSAFVSTERGWHQDDYLNPPDTYAWYAAAWIAIDDIGEDAGPFEYIPGSHRLPCMRRAPVTQLLEPEVRGMDGRNPGDHHWATFAEGFVNRIYDRLIVERKMNRLKFLAKRGDVMIWHGKLIHRGSVPRNPHSERPAMITHYSNPMTRRDIGDDIRCYRNSAPYWFFPQTPQLPEPTMPVGQPWHP